MPLDHGTLNIPLSKRGDLARIAERSVRDEAAAFEAQVRRSRAVSREKFAKARSLIAAVSDNRMAELGRPHNLTAKQARAEFISAARSNPDLLISTFSREQG